MFDMFSVFLPSFALVALGEIGDKTQLLSLALVCRFRRPWVILAAIVCATLVNHGLSAWLGDYLSGLLPLSLMHYLVAASFILLGVWMLIPDKEGDASESARYGVFVTTLVLFFLAEIGDKTQLATVVLAAQYHDIATVLVATTLGMVAANAPVLWLGQRIRDSRWEARAHRVAAVLFIAMGAVALLWP